MGPSQRPGQENEAGEPEQAGPDPQQAEDVLPTALHAGPGPSGTCWQKQKLHDCPGSPQPIGFPLATINIQVRLVSHAFRGRGGHREGTQRGWKTV